VCLSVCQSAHTWLLGVPHNTLMLIAQKWLKIRTSNLTSTSTGTVRTWPLGNFRKGGVARVTWPLNFWALNANCSNTVKGTDFKFDEHIQRESPDMTPQKIFEKRAWPWSRDSLNFWALYANCSKTVKGTNFKFDEHVPRESPDMIPEKILEKGRGRSHVNPHSCKFTWRIYALSERLLVKYIPLNKHQSTRLG